MKYGSYALLFFVIHTSNMHLFAANEAGRHIRGERVPKTVCNQSAVSLEELKCPTEQPLPRRRGQNRRRRGRGLRRVALYDDGATETHRWDGVFTEDGTAHSGGGSGSGDGPVVLPSMVTAKEDTQGAVGGTYLAVRISPRDDRANSGEEENEDDDEVPSRCRRCTRFTLRAVTSTTGKVIAAVLGAFATLFVFRLVYDTTDPVDKQGVSETRIAQLVTNALLHELPRRTGDYVVRQIGPTLISINETVIDISYTVKEMILPFLYEFAEETGHNFADVIEMLNNGTLRLDLIDQTIANEC